ncbi:hypothetical protein LXA43DRAFT_1113146 [Ganoderma leucocontextum]|nr:hypothetical protein LXA43DRAFT_1113146 [Ganoderma leucocontextum]
MLPLPASFSRTHSRRSGYGLGSGLRQAHYRSTRDVLLTRARVTNLGFLLLAAFAALSFLLNLRTERGPEGDMETLQRDRTLEGIDHLIMVPGHAIWKGTSVEESTDEDAWVLEPYQRGGGRVAAFFRHIAGGAQMAREDEHSLLVFSGGQTRPSSTTTEAESYMRLASVSDLLPTTSSSPRSQSKAPSLLRATTEDYALDSYQNLLFSLARFHEYTGRWPSKITVVGYEMKRRRFTDLHLAALRWPLDRFEYVGIDAEGSDADADADAARQGELQNGYLPYTEDAYGCHGVLLAKRRARNPFLRHHPYYSSAPELGALLNWCPGRQHQDHDQDRDRDQTAVFPGRLPWDGGHGRE